MPKKLKAEAPDGYVWCCDMWIHAAVCEGCRKRKKCIVLKTYQEAQDSGKNVAKGKGNKGK